MIAVIRLDKQLMYLNPDHIICIEETPDTVITLFNGNRYIVIDRANSIISRIIAFRARISRRASCHVAKKYLSRARSYQFGFDKSTLDVPVSGDHNNHNHTPFHSRDY